MSLWEKNIEIKQMIPAASGLIAVWTKVSDPQTKEPWARPIVAFVLVEQEDAEGDKFPVVMPLYCDDEGFIDMADGAVVMDTDEARLLYRRTCPIQEGVWEAIK